MKLALVVPIFIICFLISFSGYPYAEEMTQGSYEAEAEEEEVQVEGTQETEGQEQQEIEEAKPGEQETEAEQIPARIFVLREGKQKRANIVTAEAYLVGDILEVTLGARMLREKPRIYDVLLVGPKLGRVHYKTRETIHATIEEEEPYEITKTDGIIALSKRKRTKEATGTLDKELFKIKIPVEKVVQNKRYQLWVQLESKSRGGGRPLKFKFDIENLYELVQQSTVISDKK